jgi:hypothetical protein
VPEPGERIERENIMIEVMEATETQVTRARLRRLGSPIEAQAAEHGHTRSAEDVQATGNPPARAGAERPGGPGTRYSF